MTITPERHREISALIATLTEEEAEFAVSEIARVTGVAASPGNSEARFLAKQREQDEADAGKKFHLVLTDVGDSIIYTIREIRAITGLNLAPAKAITDHLKTHPRSLVKVFDDRMEAEFCRNDLLKIGATAEVEAV